MFRSFDLQNTGHISEKRFIKIMKTKENVSDEDINEMLEEYKKLYVLFIFDIYSELHRMHK